MNAKLCWKIRQYHVSMELEFWKIQLKNIAL